MVFSAIFHLSYRNPFKDFYLFHLSISRGLYIRFCWVNRFPFRTAVIYSPGSLRKGHPADTAGWPFCFYRIAQEMNTGSVCRLSSTPFRPVAQFHHLPRLRPTDCGIFSAEKRLVSASSACMDIVSKIPVRIPLFTQQAFVL